MPDIKLCYKCGLNERASKGSYCPSCVRERGRKWRASEAGRKYLERYRLSGERLASYIKFRDGGGFKVAKRKYSKTKKGREANKLYAYRYHFHRKYGMSLEEREAILIEQSYCCASCKIALDTLNPRWSHIDHCHKTGVVRGILCADCNVSLGRMKENPERIRKLADYAERHGARH